MLAAASASLAPFARARRTTSSAIAARRSRSAELVSLSVTMAFIAALSWNSLMHDPHDDESPDETLEPSRSQLRREALDILKLAETLANLSEAELARVPLDDDLREEVRRTRAVTSHIARKRQNQFLAKQMRKLDEESVEAIRYSLGVDREKAHRETAAMHRLETWRERLLAD